MGLVRWVLPSETHMYRNPNLKSRESRRETVLITRESLSYKLNNSKISFKNRTLIFFLFFFKQVLQSIHLV